jgi:FkbM family methyltransferase
MTTDRPNDNPARLGHILHGARGYDLIAWLFLRGREPAFRERTLELARLAPDDSVLDVGCGTGTLAIHAARHVGPTGAVHGIDPSPEMIARARKKAAKANVGVAFETAHVQTLPFPDARFDAVFATLMLHHLPRPAREAAAREIRRVVKPTGRIVVVDFGAPSPRRKGLLGHLHHRHGGIDLEQIVSLLSDAGLQVVERGALGIRDLNFAVAAPQ